MHKARHTAIPFPLCTAMMLFASPAMAHDGPHQLTYLQSLLHELSHADYLHATLAVGAIGAMAAWRLTRRKRTCTKL
jgi:hydrogenase/urease accessory protein HupE